MQKSYLKALQNASPKTISLYFIGIYNAEVLAGVAIIQRVELYAKDMFRNEPSSRLKAFFKDAVSRILKGNILVIGNLTHTGQHGILFNETISQDQFLQSLFAAVYELKQLIKQKKNKSIRAILFKDYFEEDRIHEGKSQFQKQGFYYVDVQPNMLLHLRPHWEQIGDYLNDLNTQYKTRFKRARKKLGTIQCKELSLLEIDENRKRLYALYQNVSNNASFNTFLLPENHFHSMRLELGQDFRVFGYFWKDELIGFYTLILNGNQLETYFLGYD